MHVVHVYDGHERVHEGRGSVPGVVWNVARETAAAGHDVTVVERQWEELPVLAEHDGVRFRRLPLWTGVDEPWERVPYEIVDSPLELARLMGDRANFAVAAYRQLRDLDPDVVHVHLPFAANVLATLAPWLRRRLVYTAHLGDLRLDAIEGDGVDVPAVLEYASPDAFLAKRAAKTTVLNPSIEDGFVDHGVPRERLAVVPNGVDVERFAEPDRDVVERVRQSYGLQGAATPEPEATANGGPDATASGNADATANDDATAAPSDGADATVGDDAARDAATGASDGSRPTILFVGTVMPRKGVVELVHAVGQVVEDRDASVDVVLAGEHDLDEDYTDRVHRAITDGELDDSVQLAGFVDAAELPALYALADVLAVPSLEEGFGMTAIEGMTAGTPVVATRVGGLPQVIDDGVHGRLVEPGDVDALAAALGELVDDPASRARMAERAASRATDYSWTGVTETFLSLYNQVNASD